MSGKQVDCVRTKKDIFWNNMIDYDGVWLYYENSKWFRRECDDLYGYL